MKVGDKVEVVKDEVYEIHQGYSFKGNKGLIIRIQSGGEFPIAVRLDRDKNLTLFKRKELKVINS
jgi:hypothetical protein